MTELGFAVSVLCLNCEENNIISEMTGSDKMFQHIDTHTQSREYECNKCHTKVTVVLEERIKQE